MPQGDLKSFWIEHFSRWRQASSVVAGDFLLLDGGELTTLHPNLNYAPAEAMGSTIVIDLTTSWTNATVSPLNTIDKPKSFPLARQALYWINAVRGLNDRGLQSYGGEVYADMDVRYVHSNHQARTPQIPQAVRLWDMAVPGIPQTNGDLNPPWEFETGPQDIFGSKQPLTQAAGVATPDAYYALGGLDVNSRPIPGLVKYDFQSAIWTNLTSKGFGVSGLGVSNQAIYSPLFGEQGVIIYIGGYAPANADDYAPDTSGGLQKMTNINIYDIAKGRFLKQTATMNMGSSEPGIRFSFCAVSASEAGSNTLDIYIHGGIPQAQVRSAYDSTLANVYVLSIPSFVWTAIPQSKATMRGLLSCQLVGGRQMMVLGGDDPTVAAAGFKPDPWSNGIGIFDVNAWQWASQYEPSTKPYRRAQQLVDLTRRQPGAYAWDSQAVKDLFNPQGLQNGQSGVGSGQASGGDGGGSSSNAGAIAGGVVGGFVGIGLICLAIFFFWRAKRKDRLPQQSEKDPESPQSPDGTPPSALQTQSSKDRAELMTPLQDKRQEKSPELEDTQWKVELGRPMPWEIGSSQVPERHELEAK